MNQDLEKRKFFDSIFFGKHLKNRLLDDIDVVTLFKKYFDEYKYDEFKINYSIEQNAKQKKYYSIRDVINEMSFKIDDYINKIIVYNNYEIILWIEKVQVEAFINTNLYIINPNSAHKYHKDGSKIIKILLIGYDAVFLKNLFYTTNKTKEYKEGKLKIQIKQNMDDFYTGLYQLLVTYSFKFENIDYTKSFIPFLQKSNSLFDEHKIDEEPTLTSNSVFNTLMYFAKFMEKKSPLKQPINKSIVTVDQEMVNNTYLTNNRIELLGNKLSTDIKNKFESIWKHQNHYSILEQLAVTNFVEIDLDEETKSEYKEIVEKINNDEIYEIIEKKIEDEHLRRHIVFYCINMLENYNLEIWQIFNLSIYCQKLIIQDDILKALYLFVEVRLIAFEKIFEKILEDIDKEKYDEIKQLEDLDAVYAKLSQNNLWHNYGHIQGLNERVKKLIIDNRSLFFSYDVPKEGTEKEIICAFDNGIWESVFGVKIEDFLSGEEYDKFSYFILSFLIINETNLNYIDNDAKVLEEILIKYDEPPEEIRQLTKCRGEHNEAIYDKRLVYNTEEFVLPDYQQISTNEVVDDIYLLIDLVRDGKIVEVNKYEWKFNEMLRYIVSYKGSYIFDDKITLTNYNYDKSMYVESNIKQLLIGILDNITINIKVEVLIIFYILIVKYDILITTDKMADKITDEEKKEIEKKIQKKIENIISNLDIIIYGEDKKEEYNKNKIYINLLYYYFSGESIYYENVYNHIQNSPIEIKMVYQYIYNKLIIKNKYKYVDIDIGVNRNPREIVHFILDGYTTIEYKSTANIYNVTKGGNNYNFYMSCKKIDNKFCIFDNNFIFITHRHSEEAYINHITNKYNQNYTITYANEKFILEHKTIKYTYVASTPDVVKKIISQDIDNNILVFKGDDYNVCILFTLSGVLMFFNNGVVTLLYNDVFYNIASTKNYDKYSNYVKGMNNAILVEDKEDVNSVYIILLKWDNCYRIKKKEDGVFSLETDNWSNNTDLYFRKDKYFIDIYININIGNNDILLENNPIEVLEAYLSSAVAYQNYFVINLILNKCIIEKCRIPTEFNNPYNLYFKVVNGNEELIEYVEQNKLCDKSFKFVDNDYKIKRDELDEVYRKIYVMKQTNICKEKRKRDDKFKKMIDTRKRIIGKNNRVEPYSVEYKFINIQDYINCKFEKLSLNYDFLNCEYADEKMAKTIWAINKILENANIFVSALWYERLKEIRKNYFENERIVAMNTKVFVHTGRYLLITTSEADILGKNLGKYKENYIYSVNYLRNKNINGIVNLMTLYDDNDKSFYSINLNLSEEKAKIKKRIEAFDDAINEIKNRPEDEEKKDDTSEIVLEEKKQIYSKYLVYVTEVETDVLNKFVEKLKVLYGIENVVTDSVSEITETITKVGIDECVSLNLEDAFLEDLFEGGNEDVLTILEGGSNKINKYINKYNENIQKILSSKKETHIKKKLIIAEYEKILKVLISSKKHLSKKGNEKMKAYIKHIENKIVELQK